MVLSLIAIIFSLPIYENLDYWPAMGHDADEFISVLALQRESILKYLQYPFWTPALSGGWPISSQMQSAGLSPLLLLVILFGEIIGTKISVTVHLFLGLWGMYKLARTIGCSRLLSYLPPIVFFMSGIFPLQVAEGCYYNLSTGFLPWVFVYYLNSSGHIKNITISAFFCFLIVLTGGMYPFLFYIFLFLFIHSLCECLLSKNFSLTPLKKLILLLTLTCLFSAVKFLLISNFIQQYMLLPKPRIYCDPGIFFYSFFSRNQLLNFSRVGILHSADQYVFWEYYGTYVGIIPFFIYFASIRSVWKKHFSLVFTGLFFFLMSLLALIPQSIFEICRDLFFPLLTLAHFVRYKWMFVFSLSLICGIGLTLFEKSSYIKNKFLKRGLLLGAILFIFLDLYTVNSPIFSEAFTTQPKPILKTENFEQIHRKDDIYDNSLIYPSIKANYGITGEEFSLTDGISYHCNITPSNSDSYKGEAYLRDEENSTGKLDLLYFSPNKVKVKVSAHKGAMIILNQNYHKNWKVSGLSNNKIYCTNGLVSAKVSSVGGGVITFYYFPVAFIYGILISLCSIIVCLLFIKKHISLACFKISISLLVILLAATLTNEIFDERDVLSRCLKDVKISEINKYTAY